MNDRAYQTKAFWILKMLRVVKCLCLQNNKFANQQMHIDFTVKNGGEARSTDRAL